MTKHPICIDVNSKISDVVDIMSEKELHRIPVISGKKLVVQATENSNNPNKYRYTYFLFISLSCL